METPAIVIPNLAKGMWAASVDLKDAYLHIPVKIESQNFLAFSYKGKTYKFVALPFGLSTSPRVFTRIAGTVVADLRRSGVTLYAYLDDWLVTGRSHQEALFNLGRTTERLEQLGWVINREKSHLIPTQTIQFLGAILDFHTGWGWGACLDDLTISGEWEPTWRQAHINALELEALSRALHHFECHLLGHAVTAFCDNTTVVAYVNRQGGTKSRSLCAATWDLLLWCRDNISLRASHVAGRENLTADALSRGAQTPTEWSLQEITCRNLFRLFGTPNIDLFASATNAKLPVRPDTTSPAQLADFFMILFKEGKQPNTIRNYRSAIAAIHSGFLDGSSVGTCPRLAALLKGMANRRPMRRKLPPAWSINGVLHHLARPPFEPMGSSLLRDLTVKTLFLVASASARRRSCLHALSTAEGHIRFDSQGVRLVPDPRFLAKNQTLAFIPGDIFLPKLSLTSDTAEDKLWCPVRALKWYLHRTKDLRSSQALFILPTSPHSAASKETISRWLVQAIRLHAETDQPVRAHDIRGQAASKALFQGVPVDDILQAAWWKTPSTFVASYLTDTVASESTFGRITIASAWFFASLSGGFSHPTRASPLRFHDHSGMGQIRKGERVRGDLWERSPGAQCLNYTSGV
ncbi:uncharacterized protein [Apostichopus japonicus]|uniref:uncharacterized protein n=1 Tax=Stichopus japonicus TaxID=307972 RepID=UPI003AB5C5AD